MDRPVFGRGSAPQPLRATGFGRATASGQPRLPLRVNLDPGPPAGDGVPSLDEELRTWKKQRSVVIPWKQICLTATLCFGIGSFVLPASVNGAVNWLLYGLTAMSAYAWFKARRARAKS
jgi:hypothetical protein